jgi:uncharacterized protein (DUF952 family)
MTIGIAPITRLLSTAAVNHAIVREIIFIIEERDEAHLSIHAKIKQSTTNRIFHHQMDLLLIHQ